MITLNATLVMLSPTGMRTATALPTTRGEWVFVQLPTLRRYRELCEAAR